MKNRKSNRLFAVGVVATALLLAACSDKEKLEVVSQPAVQETQQPQQNNTPQQITFGKEDNSTTGFSINQPKPDGMNEVKQQLGLPTEGKGSNGVVVIGGESPANQEEEQYEPSASKLDKEALQGAASVDEKLAEVMKANGEKDASLITQQEKVIEYADSTYNHKIVSLAQMPKEVKEWHDENKGQAGAYQMEKDGNFFLMIAAGAKPHSGFKLTVNGVYDEKKEIQVLFTLEETKSGVLSIETTPTVVIQMRKPSIPINIYNMSG